MSSSDSSSVSVRPSRSKRRSSRNRRVGSASARKTPCSSSPSVHAGNIRDLMVTCQRIDRRTGGSAVPARRRPGCGRLGRCPPTCPSPTSTPPRSPPCCRSRRRGSSRPAPPAPRSCGPRGDGPRPRRWPRSASRSGWCGSSASWPVGTREVAAAAAAVAEQVEEAMGGGGGVRQLLTRFREVVGEVAALADKLDGTVDRLQVGLALREVLGDPAAREAWVEGRLLALPGDEDVAAPPDELAERRRARAAGASAAPRWRGRRGGRDRSRGGRAGGGGARGGPGPRSASGRRRTCTPRRPPPRRPATPTTR